MKIELVRTNKKFTQGILKINDKKFCDTFEVAPLLPVGVYQITGGMNAVLEKGVVVGLVPAPMVENVPKVGTVSFQDGEKMVPFEGGGGIYVCSYDSKTDTRMYGHSCFSGLTRIFAQAWVRMEDVELEVREEY